MTSRDVTLYQFNGPHALDSGPIYRWFKKKEWARDFAAGRVRISTFAACRAAESLPQRDEKEGHQRYEVSDICGGMDDPAFREAVANLGWRMDPGARNVTIKNSTRDDQLEALVLCATTNGSLEFKQMGFGEHCVQIINPMEFAWAVTEALFYSNPYITECFAGKVVYADRTYRDASLAPGHPAFVKPIAFGEQGEVRFVWPTGQSVGIPMEIDCPPAAKFCQLLR